MKAWLNSIIVFLILLYPLAVYFGIQHMEPRFFALILIILLLIRLVAVDNTMRPIILVGLVYAGIAIWSNQLLTLRFYPVVVNIAMFLIFSVSLIYPPSLVERLARIQQPDLPPQAIIYTRRVTQIWCVFFVINGSVALATALWASLETWTLYNGLIAYLLMGLLFIGEYWVRQRIHH